MTCSRLRRFAFVFIFAATVSLAGCAQQRELPATGSISTNNEREKLARELEDKGELADALVQWKILATIDPERENYQNRVAAITESIDNKSKVLMSKGVRDFRRGAREAARLSFLKALALNPRNKDAFEYLRKLSM